MSKRFLLLEKCPNGKPSTTILIFDILSEGKIRIKNRKYSNKFFFLKDNRCLFEYNIKKHILICNYYDFWRIIRTDFSVDYKILFTIVKDVVGKMFNIRISQVIVDEQRVFTS